MTAHRWTELRATTTQLFNGDTPWPDTEAEIVQHYRQDPARVEHAINQISQDIARGRGPRSPWAALRHRLTQPALEAVVHTDDKATATRKALTRIKNLGANIEDEYELNELLYAHGEPLEAWRTDEALRAQMHNAWQARRLGRPVGRYERLGNKMVDAKGAEIEVRFRDPG